MPETAKGDVLKKAVLKNIHKCWSLFLIKLFQHRCFPVSIAKFWRRNWHLFWRTYANGCFWMSSQTAIKSNIYLLNWMKWGKMRIFVSLWYYYICILSRSNRNEVFFKKMFLKTLQNSQENTCNGVFLKHS